MFGFGKSKKEKEFDKLMGIIQNSSGDDETLGISTIIYTCWKAFDSECGSISDFLFSEEKQKDWLSFLTAIIQKCDDKIKDNVTPEEKGNYGSTLGAYLMLLYFEALANDEKRETTDKIFNVIDVYHKLGKEIAESQPQK